ncbi:MAG TPA: NUDIX domain-containing protein, partial [Ignavibacteriaceae bacterium]
AEEAVRREMNEEMGLIDLGEIKLFGTFESENIIDNVFWKRIDLNPDEIKLKEGQRIEYFDLKRIKQTELAFNYNFILEKFFAEI